MHPSAPAHASHASPSTTIAVVIPARFAATRLPGKPLADICGQTMIERVYRQAALATGVTRVLVATDDARIAKAVRAFGGHVALTRPDHQSGTDRIAEAVADLDDDLIINVQGDEPLLHPASIVEAATPLLEDPGLPMATLGQRLEPDDAGNPNVVKVVVDLRGRALYFTRASVPFLRSGPMPTSSVYRHVGLYAYRRGFLRTFAALPRTPLEKTESLEQLRALEHGHAIAVVETAHRSLSVDTPEDLERVRQVIAAASLHESTHGT